MDIINNIDLDILLFIQNHLRLSFLTPLLKWITSLGDSGSIWLFIIIILILNKKTRKIGLFTLLGYVLCLLTVDGVLKGIFSRGRPFDTYPQIIPLINKPHDFSFPSGHTSMAFTIASILYRLLDKRIGGVALVIAFLIGFSRLYLGVHFFSDVLAGIFVGLVLGKIVEWLYNKYEKNLV